tara:strand:- start:312 stop:1214 length:903 start_codon:yes stop_codon:yes gene_type:complete
MIETDKNPLVSIIMNCHNGEKYLKESLESVISQTYKNWELIFWDNKSSDKSEEIFKSFDDHRLKYFYNNELTTLYKARNLSLEKSNGEFITFLDTDDYWSKEKLRKQVNFFLENINFDIIYGNYFIINEKLKTKKIAFSNKDLVQGFIQRELLKKYVVGLVSIFFKKKLSPKFDERFEIIGDFDFIIKISKNHKFGAIKEPLCFYRLHNQNYSLINKKKHYEEMKIWYDENLDKDKKIEKNIKNKFKNSLFELKFIFFLLEGKKIEAIKILKYMPFSVTTLKFIIFTFLPLNLLKKLINR